MEGILHTFGIDGRLIVIQIFNFVLLLAVLWYFLYTPVLKMLASREEKIRQGMEDAKKASEAREAAEGDKQAILSAANKEAEAVALRAKEHADVKASDIVASAEAKAQSVVKDAETKSEEIKIQARKDSEAEISKLAVLAAEKVLRQEA